MSSKYSTPELRACKSNIWMRVNRYSKSCRHFVKAEIRWTKALKTLEKQQFELFAHKSQYELRVNTENRVQQENDACHPELGEG